MGPLGVDLRVAPRVDRFSGVDARAHISLSIYRLSSLFITVVAAARSALGWYRPGVGVPET